MKKIHCEIQQLPEEEFDKITISEFQDMIGWIEPNEDGTWDVVMSDGGYFECKDQATAQIISSIEEIKTLLLRK